MGFFSKFFNAVPPDEREGIHLDFRVPRWKVSSPKTFSSFLRALVDLVPEGAIAYLEGGSPSGAREAFLKERSVPEVSHVAMGTIWPRPKVFHVPATADNLLELADIAEHCAEPEIAVHFHIYMDNRVILEWFDAFLDPLYLSNEIPEDTVGEFCAKLSIEYEMDTEGVDPTNPAE